MMRRLTYANVMSTVAVFIALGGTSYAAIKLPKDSVGSRELKKNAVTESKLRNGAVTGDKVQDGSLTLADLSGPLGARGPRGAEGPAGPIGPTGGRGPSDIYFARGGGKLADAGQVWVDVAKLSAVPAGKWWFSGTAAIVAGASADWYRCALSFGTTAGASGAVVRVGTAGGGDDASLASQATVDDAAVLTGPTDVFLRCTHDGTHPGGDQRVDHAALTGIRTDNLVIQ